MRRFTHLLPAALLLPFLHKAFNVDDTLFFLLARQVAAEGLGALKEPILWDSLYIPAGSFPHPLPWPALLALASRLFGESEVPLHLLTFGFALLALHGMGILAGRLGVSRLLASLLLAGSGVFLALGSTVIPDLPMTGCLLAGIGHLVRGVDEDRRADLVLAGLLAGVGCLFRYSAVLGIGLALLYPLLTRARRPRAYLPALLAIGVLGAWELTTTLAWGKPHFLSSVGTWSQPLTRGRLLASGTAELVQLGGQLPALWLTVGALLLGRPLRRGLALSLAAVALLAVQAVSLGDRAALPLALFFLWPALALLVHALAAALESVPRLLRDVDRTAALRLLLAAWLVLGTFATISYVHIAAKYMLLPLPAAVLLALDACGASRPMRLWAAVSAAATVLLGLAIGVSDARWAAGYRRYVAEHEVSAPSGRTFVNGDWGLRFYGEKRGWVPYHGEPLTEDDRYLSGSLVSPTWALDRPALVPLERKEVVYDGPFALVAPRLDAGFHSSNYGRYPYVPADRVIEQIGVFRGTLRPAP